MIAKFAGTCRTCRGPIQEGDEILYDRQRGARHPNCDPKRAPRPRAESVWDRLEQIFNVGMSAADLDLED